MFNAAAGSKNSPGFDPAWPDQSQVERMAVIQATATERPAAGQSRSPCPEACEAARDAWDQVQNAIADGSQAKASAH